jgi:2-polyprenyl-6-methoxyphenol hydroxylase-like FAD-dependent oxidoreductase
MESDMSQDRRDDGYDAVVVGGRVAGASTALLLARAGHRVAVLDRVRFPSDTLSTHLIWPSGVIQLRRWGLLEAIEAAGTPMLPTIRSDVDGTAVEFPVWAESGVEAVCAPRRTVLDPTILAAAESAGVAVFEGVTVDGLSRDGRGRIDGVVGHRDDGRPLRIAAGVVVGADGWRSRVARDAGAAAYDEREPSNAIHYAYWSGLENRGVELWFHTRGLMAGVFPTNGGACVYVNCRSARSGELRRDVDRNYLRFVAEAAPDLAARLARATRTSPVRGTPGLPGFVRRAHGPGWVLVGDAGCTNDPASAHGITAALRDAELAAVAIDAGIRDPATAEEALQAFEAARDRSRPLYDLGWAIATYEWDAPTVLELLTRFSVELIREAQETAVLPARSGPLRAPTLRGA